MSDWNTVTPDNPCKVCRKGKFGVKLETRRFNGRYETTVEAVHTFLAAVNRAAEPKNVVVDRREKELAIVSTRLTQLLDSKVTSGQAGVDLRRASF